MVRTTPVDGEKADDHGAEARRFPGLPLDLLAMRVGLAPGTTYDPEGPCLWVRRRNPLERAFAWLMHRREPRLRVEVDRVSAWVLSKIPAEGTRPVVEIGHEMGVPMPEDPLEAARTGTLAQEPHEGLVSFLVFLKQMHEGGALRAEPI